MNIDMNRFRGAHTAIVTPFDTDWRLDPDRLKQQIEVQVAGLVQGIVAVGTTGESPTLNHKEHIEVIETAVKTVNGRVLVIAGTGGNSTVEAIALSRDAERVGADALLQVVPYYNKPTQSGMIQHFSAIAKVVQLPILLYNIPGRCVVDMTVDTVWRLRDATPNIIGIKEASGSCDRVTELRARLGPEFIILSGDDSLTLPFMSAGADGVISVVSNVMPRSVAQMVDAIRRWDFRVAQYTHARLYPFVKSLFLDGNPAGVKCAMRMLGRDTGMLRLPLVPVSKSTEDAIRAQLLHLGLLQRVHI